MSQSVPGDGFTPMGLRFCNYCTAASYAAQLPWARRLELGRGETSRALGVACAALCGLRRLWQLRAPAMAAHRLGRGPATGRGDSRRARLARLQRRLLYQRPGVSADRVFRCRRNRPWACGHGRTRATTVPLDLFHGSRGCRGDVQRRAELADGARPGVRARPHAVVVRYLRAGPGWPGRRGPVDAGRRRSHPLDRAAPWARRHASNGSVGSSRCTQRAGPLRPAPYGVSTPRAPAVAVVEAATGPVAPGPCGAAGSGGAVRSAGGRVCGASGRTVRPAVGRRPDGGRRSWIGGPGRSYPAGEHSSSGRPPGGRRVGFLVRMVARSDSAGNE